MNTDKVNEIVMRMMIIAPGLTADNTYDVERLKELATEMLAELNK